jgi:hypothetical protein
MPDDPAAARLASERLGVGLEASGPPPSFLYAFGGLEIRSSAPIPWLMAGPPAGDALTIIVERTERPISGKGPVLFRWPGRYDLTLRAHDRGWMFTTTHVAAAVSEDAQSVQCHADARWPGWSEILVRRVLPRLAQWHGRLALHAATVADGESAIVILGPSGAGKSTLAAALCRFGPWRLLSDDISLLDGAGPPESPMAWPSGAGPCLWPDSLTEVVSAPMRSRLLAGHTQKRWVDTDPGAPSAAPGRVVAILVLTRDDVAATSIRPMAPSEAARWAGALMIAFNPADPALVARSWAAVGRLVTAVPAFALSYPRRYGALADVTSTLSVRFGERALTTT